MDLLCHIAEMFSLALDDLVLLGSTGYPVELELLQAVSVFLVDVSTGSLVFGVLGY
jgi:hypothetical protein